MFKNFKLRFLLIIVAVFVLAACGNNSDGNNSDVKDKVKLTAGSGTTGGVYYPYMGELSTLFENNINIDGFTVNVSASGGSVENIGKTISGDFDLSLAQNNLMNDAIKGEGEFEGIGSVDNIGVIASLFPEVVQVVTLKSKNINTLQDLKGKRIGVGAPGSGNKEASELLLSLAGINDGDYSAYEEGFSDAKSKLQDGNIDAAIVVNAVPASTVEELQSTTKELKFLELDKDIIKEFVTNHQYTEYKMEAGTYEWQNENLNTVAFMGMLIANTDQVSEEIAYEITKSLFEHSEDMKIAQAKLISKDAAFTGVGTLPLHPGAKKYYEEEGMLDNYEGE